MTFIWKNPQNKKYHEKHWFDLWIKESYNVRQLSQLSGYSKFKIKQIKNYWLSKEPPPILDYTNKAIKYLLFDGTYFHKSGCCIIIIDNQTKIVMANQYVDKERYLNAYEILNNLKEQGIYPKAITTDGHTQVTYAIAKVYPNIILQRCLYHIQRQGLSWLRTYPKTQAGKDLKELLLTLSTIKTETEKNTFLQSFFRWDKAYKKFIENLPNDSVAMKDLKRTVSLIKRALPDMFHYIYDKNIAPTTNSAESFFSRLKSDFQRHRGLSEKHKVAYLKWYIYFKNNNIF